MQNSLRTRKEISEIGNWITEDKGVEESACSSSEHVSQARGEIRRPMILLCEEAMKQVKSKWVVHLSQNPKGGGKVKTALQKGSNYAMIPCRLPTANVITCIEAVCSETTMRIP